MAKKPSSGVCSFKIEVNLFKAFLRYVKATGIDTSGSKSILVTDCILRFETDKIYAIVTDEKRALVVQIKASISDVQNPVPIPLEISEMEKMLSSFEDSDIIKIIYEKGMIGLKNIEKKEFLDFDLVTDVIFSTKREDTISFDLITNLQYGDEKDSGYLKKIEELGNSIFKELEDDKIELFFGSILRSSVELSARQLKKVISDGERIENREYPFEFEDKKLKITIKSSDEAKKDRISRDLYSKKYKIIEPFTVTFSNRLSYAVNNITGYVNLYVDKDCPMLIKSIDSEEKGLEIAYLVTSY